MRLTGGSGVKGMSSGTAKQLSPGEVWLKMPTPQQVLFLQGLVQFKG
jgi:hypothetical protein